MQVESVMEKIREYNDMIDCGCVYWITGLSGAGKTTVGTKLYEYLKRRKDNVIRLDGDILRQIFLNQDYSPEGRKALGLQYGSLCKMISIQGVDVVICTIAMYDDIRAWNRENIPDYREIYLDVSMEELVRRDQKGLYSKAADQKESNVAGVNMEIELPKHPDLVIKNYGGTDPDMALGMIIDKYGL